MDFRSFACKFLSCVGWVLVSSIFVDTCNSYAQCWLIKVSINFGINKESFYNNNDYLRSWLRENREELTRTGRIECKLKKNNNIWIFFLFWSVSFHGFCISFRHLTFSWDTKSLNRYKQDRNDNVCSVYVTFLILIFSLMTFVNV